MKTTDKILILVSIPITLIFLIAIASQYYALLYTKEINKEMQDELFQSQINFSTKFTSLISQQLNREAQKIPFISNLVNRYVAKLFAGKVKNQSAHKNTLVNMEQLYLAKEDPTLQEQYRRNNLLVNSWYHKNHTSISTLDNQAQEYLNNLYRFNVLQKTFALEQIKNKIGYSRRLSINDLLYVMQYQGLFITSGKNATFSKYPQCLGPGLFPYDPRCRPWYVNTANKVSMQLYPPDFVYSRTFSFIVQLSCSRVEYFNQSLNSNDVLSVLCVSVSLSSFQDFFSNFANSTKQLYFIDARSQSILFQSNYYEGMTALFNLTQVELKYLQTKDDAQNLNNTIKQYFSMWNYMQLNTTDRDKLGEIESYQKKIEYNRNGTKTLAILSPVMIYEKLPYYEGVKVPSDRQKYNVNIPYLQINIISDEDLKEWANQLEVFFSRYFLIVNIVLGSVGFISILITLYYSFRIRNMINASVMHLTKVLKQMINFEITKDLMQEDMDYLFLSQETRLLYQSFQGIYQILLYTSENFFESNDTETLLRLHRNVEFFKQFGNIQAVGITHNNIGSIFLSQGHYFQALEQFNSSIIYAKYEIQQFCKVYPNSFSAFLIAEFGYTKTLVEINLKDKETNQSRGSSFMQFKSLNRSTQKSRQQSSSNNQVSNFGSILTNFDGKTLNNYDQFIQTFLKNSNLIGKSANFLNMKGLYEEYSDQRIQLLQNLFYRKRNYIITLLAFQESIDSEVTTAKNTKKFQDFAKLYNFWKEIKDLLKDLLIISKQLPNCELYEIEINSLLQKCQFQLQNNEKSSTISSQTETMMNAMTQSQIKQQKLRVPKFQDDFRSKKQSNFYDLCKSFLEPNSQNTSQIFDQKMMDSMYQSNMKSVEQDNKNEEYSTAKILQNTPTKKLTDGGYLDLRKKISSNQTSFMNSIAINESTNNMFLDKKYLQKKRDTRLDKSNKLFLESIRRSTVRNQNSTKASNQQKDLEILFEFRRKLETALEDNSQLQNYYSLDNLDLIYSFSKAECLIQLNQFRKAAIILTSLIENKRQIISHYPYKIVSLLKQIFNKQSIISEELNQFYNKFNRNISMQTAIVFDCQRNSKLIFKTIHLASDIVSTVFENNSDQLGVVLVDQQDKFIQSFMTFTNVQQLKGIMNKIIDNIINIVSEQDNNLFVSFISQLCEEIQAQDMSMKMNDSFNAQQNQFSFNHIDNESPQNNSKVAAHKMKINFDDKEILEREESNIDENFSSIDQVTFFQNTTSCNCLNPKNVFNISKFTQQNDKNLDNLRKKFTSKLENHTEEFKLEALIGDDISIQSKFEFLSQEVLTEKPDKSKAIKQYYFHMAIHKTLSHLFSNQVQYFTLISNLLKKNKKEFKVEHNTLQQRYIIYSTDEVNLNQNFLFFNLCKILQALNIKVLLFVENKGNSFIEQLPDQTFYYNNVDIFRVVYTDQQVLNYLKTNRNKFCNTSYPTIIQHY